MKRQATFENSQKAYVIIKAQKLSDEKKTVNWCRSHSISQKEHPCPCSLTGLNQLLDQMGKNDEEEQRSSCAMAPVRPESPRCIM